MYYIYDMIGIILFTVMLTYRVIVMINEPIIKFKIRQVNIRKLVKMTCILSGIKSNGGDYIQFNLFN